MRLVSYQHHQRVSWGMLVADNLVLDCSSIAPSLKAAIENNQLSQLWLFRISRGQAQDVVLGHSLKNPVLSCKSI